MCIIQELTQLRNKYNKRVHDELDKIKAIKDEVINKRYELRQTEKKLNEIKLQNNNIVHPLNQVKIEDEKLKLELEEYKSEKQVYNQRKSKLKEVENKLKDVEWRHEVLFQRYELLKSERDKLVVELEKSTLQMKQRNNLQSLMLQKLTKKLHGVLETKYDFMLKCNPSLGTKEHGVIHDGKDAESGLTQSEQLQQQVIIKLQDAIELVKFHEIKMTSISALDQSEDQKMLKKGTESLISSSTLSVKSIEAT